MKPTFASESARRVVPRHQQITDEVRSQILRGELAPGASLPSMHELAAQFNTSYFTIQTALGPLVAEGLLERRRRTGTVVKYNRQVLTCAAIYCGNSLLDTREEAFASELCRQVQSQLSSQHVRSEIFMDLRPEEERSTPLPQLVRAVERQEVQAIIVTRGNHRTLPWLTQLPVHMALGATTDAPCRATYDQRQMLRLGLGRLRELGCRQVGLICSIHTPPHTDSRRWELQFYDDFIDELQELGLSTRDAWVRAPREWQERLERHGYDQFKCLWRQTERPEGILVYPDVVARGVMAAALELGVRTPDDLKLVFHHNTGVDWVCPLTVDWVESDVAAWAAALIRQIRRQKAGETVTPIILDYRLGVVNGEWLLVNG